MKSGFSFGLETENYGLHWMSAKTFREDPGSHPTRKPCLKHCKEEWISTLLHVNGTCRRALKTLTFTARDAPQLKHMLDPNPNNMNNIWQQYFMGKNDHI